MRILLKKRVILSVIAIILVALLLPTLIFVTRDLKISLLKSAFLNNRYQKIGTQTNILLLGIPGEPHDGPYLSDSILVLNYDNEKNRIVTINIPRDVWSDTLQEKINTAYAFGEAKKPGSGGISLARAEVGAIVGFPIQYVAVINFAGFKDLIDFLGGVDVMVERSFVDRKYPIAGRESDDCGKDSSDSPDTDPAEAYPCRFETIQFEEGKTHMNGETALKFVRSRNAEGAEGSDFARGRRQEKVIEAIKGEVTKIIISPNIDKKRKLYALSQKIISRNIDNQEVAYLMKNMVLKGKLYTKTFSLTNDLFEVPPIGEYGRYVLVPKSSFPSIHRYITCLIDREDEKACEALKNE